MKGLSAAASYPWRRCRIHHAMSTQFSMFSFDIKVEGSNVQVDLDHDGSEVFKIPQNSFACSSSVDVGAGNNCTKQDRSRFVSINLV